jgi:hypothetical protein
MEEDGKKLFDIDVGSFLKFEMTPKKHKILQQLHIINYAV